MKKRAHSSHGTGNETAWLKRRRCLVNKVASAGSDFQPKACQQLSKELWCPKQIKETQLQASRDHTNRSLAVHNWLFVKLSWLESSQPKLNNIYLRTGCHE